MKRALMAGTMAAAALVVAPAGVSASGPAGSTVEITYGPDFRFGDRLYVQGTDQPDEISVEGLPDLLTIRTSAPITLTDERTEQNCELESATVARCGFDVYAVEGVSIYGRSGDDDLLDETASGFSILHGDDGNDQLTGGEGEEELQGGRGADQIEGGEGGEFIDGGAGRDQISGSTGSESIRGASGRDQISGGDHRDRLLGGRGRDDLRGGGGPDELEGQAGRDRFRGGQGSDELDASQDDRDKVVACGPGRADKAELDEVDPRPRGCETTERI
ncbi:MAG TPA: calcium-binding protein [Solirubrobacterales bacterium]|nr:calcium-binding protein [Solirubrobacterales bacterium]